MKKINKTFKLILVLGIAFLGSLLFGITKAEATSAGIIIAISIIGLIIINKNRKVKE